MDNVIRDGVEHELVGVPRRHHVAQPGPQRLRDPRRAELVGDQV
jgi:hypothetical protein